MVKNGIYISLYCTVLYVEGICSRNSEKVGNVLNLTENVCHDNPAKRGMSRGGPITAYDTKPQEAHTESTVCVCQQRVTAHTHTHTQTHTHTHTNTHTHTHTHCLNPLQYDREFSYSRRNSWLHGSPAAHTVHNVYLKECFFLLWETDPNVAGTKSNLGATRRRQSLLLGTGPSAGQWSIEKEEKQVGS